MSLLLESQQANNKHNTARKVLDGNYTLIGLYQKSHTFAALTR